MTTKVVGNYRDRRLEAMGRMEGRERLIVAERMSGRTKRRKQRKSKTETNCERCPSGSGAKRFRD